MAIKNRALQYALDMLRDGQLSIDEDGYIWRHQILVRGEGYTYDKWKSIIPRRAENASKKGYLRLNLQVEGKLYCVGAHRVVWTYLKGEIPEGLQINHKDLVKSNNRIDNLEVVSQSSNIQHALQNGCAVSWSNPASVIWRNKSRITMEQKEEIRELRFEGYTLKEIGSKYNITEQRVYQICHESH